MTFWVAKSLPFWSLGRYKSSGKHAAPKRTVLVPKQRQLERTDQARRPAHAAAMPRLTGSHADKTNAVDKQAA